MVRVRGRNLGLRVKWPKLVVFGFWTGEGTIFWVFDGNFFGGDFGLILMVSEKRWNFGSIWGWEWWKCKI